MVRRRGNAWDTGFRGFLQAASSSCSRAAVAECAWASIARYWSINLVPNGVNAAPPPRDPPFWAATTGSRKQLFISSTRSQARRYDMPNAMPAWVIDPVSRIASSNRIFPGPIARPSPKSTRKVSRAAATLVAPIASFYTAPTQHSLRSLQIAIGTAEEEQRSCDFRFFRGPSFIEYVLLFERHLLGL